MACRISLLVVLSVFVVDATFHQSVAQEQAPNVRARCKEALSADSPSKKAYAYRRLFEDMPLATREKLSTDPRAEIALFAGWEDCLGQLERFDPPPGSEEAESRDQITNDKLYYRIRPAAVRKFIARVSSHLEVEIPKWWGQDVANGRVFDGDFHFGGLMPAGAWGMDWVGSLTLVILPADLEVHRNGRVTRLGRGCDSMNASALDIHDGCRGEQEPGSIALAFSRTDAFLFHGDQIGKCGYLRCINRETGRTKWKTRTWQSYSTDEEPEDREDPGSYAGYDMRVGCRSVVLFGYTELGGSIEAFDKRTGKPLFRFSTSYWEWRSAFGWRDAAE